MRVLGSAIKTPNPIDSPRPQRGHTCTFRSPESDFQDHARIRSGRGLLYGLGLFVLNDEIAGPALGIASGPTEYPWQAHVRGLAGHLMLGAATEVAIEAMDKAA